MRTMLLGCLLLSTAAVWASPLHYPTDQPPFLAVANKNTEEGSFQIIENTLEQDSQSASRAAMGVVEKAKKIMDDNELEKELEKDIRKESLIIGVVGALTLLYNTISDTLLYPFFSFLFVTMTIVLIFLLFRLIVKYRTENFAGTRQLLFVTSIFLLIYIDVFLVIYEQRKVLLLFLELKKDIILIGFAAGIGFLRGKLSSRRNFEDNLVP